MVERTATMGDDSHSGSTPSPPSPIRELREAFGDSKPPDISRKITACVACRKQKIKCHMPSPGQPCTRCKKRGLSCTVNRSLQMLLESDTVWKQSVEKKIETLQNAIGKLSNQVVTGDILQGPQAHRGSDTTKSGNISAGQPSQGTPGIEHQQPGHWNIVLDPASGPGAVPGSYITQATTTPSTLPESCHRDLISKGIISLDSAKSYFDMYQQRLDHFVYRILGDHSAVSFESTREASPLLIASICTVGALHCVSRQDDFDACRGEFLALSEKHNMSQIGTVEDVRALCIGAFWLPDLSWPLVGAAVRIATGMQLHKSFYKAMQGDRAHYLRARLYYHVYACDHHASIAFGRPPLTRECEAIREARDFLRCQYATEDDARLVSQVCRWSLLSGIYDAFGVNVDRPLSEAEVSRLRSFGVALDSLRAEWAERFIPNAHVGNYPRKGVSLQYHFAKLYLYSHAFRGAGSSRGAQSGAQDVAMELDEIANVAILSALSILRFVISDPEIQSFLDGLPTYFDTMITFAAVFLLKVSFKPISPYIRLDSQEVTHLVSETVTVLKGVTSTMHPRHLLVSVARGIENLLEQRSGLSVEAQDTASIPNGSFEFPGIETWNDADFTFDPYFLGACDFQTTNQATDFGLDSLLDNTTSPR